MTRRRRTRRDGGLLVAAVLVGTGLLYADAALLSAAVIPLVYVLYGAVSRLPADTELSVERSVDPSPSPPGTAVDVTLTVRNDAGGALPDVRVRDGVPDGLEVVSGSPRACGSLRAGEAVTARYTVVAGRGTSRFDDPAVSLRSFAGTAERTTTVTSAGDAAVYGSNAPPKDASSAAARASADGASASAGGSEFYATREYRPGDPMSRIDWTRVAKTGEYVTVQYREERPPEVAVITDARPIGRASVAPGYPSAAALSAHLGERIYRELAASGIDATAAAVGLDPGSLDAWVDAAGIAWLEVDTAAPGRRRDDRSERFFAELDGAIGRDAQPLGAAPEGDPTAGVPPIDPRTGSAPPANASADRPDRSAPTESEATAASPTSRLDGLLARIPAEARVVVCTPLFDEWPVSLARALRARGHRTVVAAPEAAGSRGDDSADSPDARVARIGRLARIEELERSGARAVSWDVDRSIDRARRRSVSLLTER
ncbi:DUF58 domain-containing protein [Natronomonas sp.]|uniref:DUF58 domain-containing protein n=1 Tax=Natronomonas sp. TaxID=2184060 RepID=UPI0026156FDB|nr:DUF58 domain-containing protein [Natronomonas sp.]